MIKTNKKYRIYFCRAQKCKANKNLHKKTSEWIVRKDSEKALAEYLGMIKWHGAWRQFVFWPDEKTCWSIECLKEISEFVKKLNERQRKKWKKLNRETIKWKQKR